jgi:autotransporter-associated beta strand protein
MILLLAGVTSARAVNTLVWDGGGDGTWSGSNWWNGSSYTFFTNGTSLQGSASGNILTVSDTTGLFAGQVVYGSQVTANQTVQAVGTGQVTLSANASAATTNQTYTFSSDDLTFNGRNGVGTVTVSGTQFANSMTITAAGYNFSGGTIVLSRQGNGASAPLVVSASTTIGSKLIVNGNLNFGAANTALTLTGGGSFMNVDIVSGGTATSTTSSLVLSSGSYAAANNYGANIGDVATGNNGLVVKTGAILTSGLYFIGNGANGGVATVNGGYVLSSALVVGKGGGTGRLTLSSGTLTATGAGNPNSAAVTGVTIGSAGTGRFDMSGGVFNNSGFLNIASALNGQAVSGYVSITGGTANIVGVNFGSGYYTNSGTTANMGSGTFALSGGLVNITSGTGMMNSGSGNFGYDIILSGGTLAASAAWSSTLNMTLGSTGGSKVTFQTSSTAGMANNITLGGVLSGTGGLNKTGGGTLILQGANAYSGQTVVSAGLLKLDSTGSLTIVLAALGGNAALSGAGNLELDGVININFSGASGSSWTIIGSDLLANTNFANANWLAGFTNNGSGLWTDNLTGNYTFDQATGILSVVPEPSVCALLGFGVMTLLVLRWGLYKRVRS